MDELIKRLRQQAKLTRRYCPTAKIPTLEENAANAIEKLQVKLDQMRKERDAAVADAACANNLIKLIYRHLREYRGLQED